MDALQVCACAHSAMCANTRPLVHGSCSVMSREKDEDKGRAAEKDEQSF